MLVVQVDSTERDDIPPFGHEIDYLTFGGIYREVSLRVVPQVYLDNMFARPMNVLSGKPTLEVDCFLAGRLRVACRWRSSCGMASVWWRRGVRR